MDLSGNSLTDLIFNDGQFNTGTLNVINSFVQGNNFTTFITHFDSMMSSA